MPVTIIDDITAPRPRIGYNNIFATGTLSASSEDTANDGYKENATDWLTFTRWKTVGTGDHYLQSVGASQSLTYGFIFGHNLGTLGVGIKFQYSDDAGSNWTDLTATIYPSTSNECIYKIWDAVNGGYVRAVIVGVTGTDQAEIGVCLMGWDMVCERGLAPGASTPFQNDDSYIYNPMTQGGQDLPRSIIRRGFKFPISLMSVSENWFRNNWLPFQEHALKYPFAYMPIPTVNPLEIVYGKLTNKAPKSVFSQTMYVTITANCDGRWLS